MKFFLLLCQRINKKEKYETEYTKIEPEFYVFYYWNGYSGVAGSCIFLVLVFVSEINNEKSLS